MSELAFNKDGERFKPSPKAAHWRTRRVRDRGLEVVYKRGGCSPLTVPIDCTEEEFADEVGRVRGKYRLDQLDDNFEPIGDAPPAYVFVHAPHDDAESTAAPDDEAAPAPRRPLRRFEAPAPMSETGLLLKEAIHVNAEVSRCIAEKMSSVLEAAAHLVQAADGAGMPARQPLDLRNAVAANVSEPEEGDDEGDDDERQPHSTWADVVKECLSYVDVFLGMKRGATRARNAAPSAEPRAGERTAKAADAPVEITSEMRAHFMAIFLKLTTEEQAFAKEVANELTETERSHWMRELMTMSVDEAVAMFRSKMTGTPAEEAAS